MLPAAVLVTIIVLVIFAACVLAAWTTRQPSNNGLRFESDFTHNRRSTHNGRQ